ncbi:protein-L-isoaspartate(D-aspartate) O-methyltransferase [Entomortierella parvispora]|uniref:Protein-L-isoaspartate O-methyltransferase n=1 Tax=Entomortierella parvispora TaxID=205924 RepID=A0A9P3LRS2_9FUNG|nr:protein-L-isoaspartate(D-aspartate) O-methyltransferase [Entomortierella parvispora]
MAWRCSGNSNEELIQNLARAHIIKDPAVKAAMLAVDRGHFSRYKPYEDAPQTIGHQSTISAPHMHAAALESLSPYLGEGAKVLDIGSGSGYLTVCMAHMVGPTGRVVGVEHIPELVEQSKKNTAKDQPSFLEEGRVAFFAADGRVGFPQEAPYDCIHVGAAAESMHKELVEQLKAPGRMFIPVSDRAGQGIYVVDKDKNGRVTKSRTMDVWYVPLTDVQTQYER